MISEEIIMEVKERLKLAAPDSTIILFGSYARGDAREGSDLDILVVEPDIISRRREMVRLHDALRSLRIPVDILVTSNKNFEEWSDTPGTVIYEAAKKGKVLYTTVRL
ncbi:MAG: nucleotidyltransferase domain-containing protein [bacterium]|nr:nucleotidyltransferase domain-containing protein [bacterium]